MPRRRSWKKNWTPFSRSDTPFDQNQHYMPTGSVRRADYRIWAYQSLEKPSYLISGDCIVTENVPFSNVETYTIDVQHIPDILVADPINIDRHFQGEFSAPRPQITYPKEPAPPPPKTPFGPKPYPPPPVRKERPPISLPARVLSLGLTDLYRRMLKPSDESSHAQMVAKWRSECSAIDTINQEQKEQHQFAYERLPAVQNYRSALAAYETCRTSLASELKVAAEEWQRHKRHFNEDRLHDIKRFIARENRAEDSLKMTLHATPFSISIPRIYDLMVDEEQKIILLEISVPAASNIVFTQTRNLASSAKQVAVPKREQPNWYNTFLYSMLVRAIYDMANSPRATNYHSIAANLVSHYKNPADGKDKNSIIASVVVAIEAAKKIDRKHLDPVETFRAWRGVAAKVLSDMVAVQPVVIFDKGDRRIIEGRDISAEQSVDKNLATLDWQEFEHLVRQLFELEFKATGADVRVTQSSRDRGVDCIIFDPDPIRGGKIVVQAKRYTNTVDVSSVRDLFGTVQAEGANRGILVTTSSYGGDSYEFAKNKPLTLLDGNNLLALLQKHGFAYRINIREARKMMQKKRP
jgi:restriction system protein